MKEIKNDFTKGEVWRVIMRMALPLMLAQLVNVLYSVVDRMYIGHIPDVGSLALTGMGLCIPIVSIVIAFASLCGTGGGPLCSIARGEGKKQMAEEIMGNCFTLLLIFALCLTLLLEIFAKPILYAFGASDATFPYADEYVRIYLLGTIFVMISLGMNHFINAQGFASVGMLTVAIGALTNIVLDPIFIFIFDMGIAGAALATVIAQAVSAVWALSFLLGKKAILDFRRENMRLKATLVRRILALGVTGFIMSITNALVQTACNRQLQLFGGDNYVGAMTIINSVRELTFMAAHGLTAGAQPVLGYNYGAGAFSRVKKGIRFVSASSLVYGFSIWLLVMIMPRTLASIFNSDPILLAATERSMRIYFCGFFLMALQLAGQCVFVGLGKSRQAVFFSLLRKALIVTPLVILLPHIPALGVEGVFWSEPISDLIGGAACFITMYFTVYKKLPKDGLI